MLTAQRFNRLTNPEKYGTLEDNGIYLDCYRIEGPFKIALFSMHSFYVEVYLNQGTDRLVKALAFNSYKRLDPFLENININELLKRPA
jgi:hypothetical protein